MAGNHLDDAQLLDLAMGQLSPEEVGSGRDHCARCLRCRERLEVLRPLVEGFVELSEAEEVPTLSPELWRQLYQRAEPLLEALSRRRSRPASKRAASSGRILPRRSWAVAASVLLLLGATGGAWFLLSSMAPTAAAAIVQTIGPVEITQPGQAPRQCRSQGELLRAGDILSAPEADAAVHLDDASQLSLRRGCRLEAQPPAAERQAAFVLREGSVCVDTTRAKRGVLIETPGGTVRCVKGKTHVQVTSPKECTATPLEGEVVVESSGHVGVVSAGVCAELKRSKPCCYRPARPRETQCDWVDRCGKPKDGRKK